RWVRERADRPGPFVRVRTRVARHHEAWACSALRLRERRLRRPSPMPERGAHGFSLVEMVVATSLTLAVLLVALALLDLLRRSFLRSELAADAAKRARLAQASIEHDLRLAGLGVDPDGAAGRPDEAIEGAWSGAIVARGDLDAEDPQARDDPERWIAGAFPVTCTGNDEIVAYALRDESG